MEDRIKQLYQQVILEHNRTPCFFEKNEGAPLIVDAYNPLCGDRFTLFFSLEEKQFSRVSFHGYGCAISKASASVLVKKIQDLHIDDFRKLFDMFYKIVSTGSEGGFGNIQDDELLAFSGARSFPGRQKCATLVWDGLSDFIQDKFNV